MGGSLALIREFRRALRRREDEEMQAETRRWGLWGLWDGVVVKVAEVR